MNTNRLNGSRLRDIEKGPGLWSIDTMKAYLETDEIEKLINAAVYLRDEILIRILFHLGCRISEALGISVSDIDFDAGIVTIQHLKSRINLSTLQCSVS